MGTNHVILVNGPPGSGKDEVGRIIREAFGARVTKFAKRLKEMTHALYGLMEGAFPRPHDYYEDCKNDPHADFKGISPRNAYIAVSEKLLKPLHGDHIFGQLILEEIAPLEDEIIVITDSGFYEEAQVVIEHYGTDVVKMLQMHRPHHDFSGDSRSYVDIDSIKTEVIDNSGTIADLEHLLNSYAVSYSFS